MPAANRCAPHEVGKFKPDLRPGTVTANFGSGELETRELYMNSRKRAERMFDPILRFLNDKEDCPRREIARALGLDVNSKLCRSDLNYALQLLKKRGFIKQDKHGWTPLVAYQPQTGG